MKDHIITIIFYSDFIYVSFVSFNDLKVHRCFLDHCSHCKSTCYQGLCSVRIYQFSDLKVLLVFNLFFSGIYAGKNGSSSHLAFNFFFAPVVFFTTISFNFFIALSVSIANVFDPLCFPFFFSFRFCFCFCLKLYDHSAKCRLCGYIFSVGLFFLVIFSFRSFGLFPIEPSRVI